MRIAVSTSRFLAEQQVIVRLLTAAHHEVVDVNKQRQLDIGDASLTTARLVNDGQVERAIILDDYAQTSFMIASKFPRTIVASLYDEYSAAFTMKHNNANVVCFALAVTGLALVQQLTRIYLATGFDAGRHMVRIDMLREMLREEPL